MKYKDIKNLSERCEDHPDADGGVLTRMMLVTRLLEEIGELREYIESRQAQEPAAFMDSKGVLWDCMAYPDNCIPLYTNALKGD